VPVSHRHLRPLVAAHGREVLVKYRPARVFFRAAPSGGVREAEFFVRACEQNTTSY
jgi:hypothetical protein